MRSVNDGCYLPEGKSKDAQQSINPRKNKFFFVQMLSADSMSEMKDFRIVSVNALQNVDEEEELSVNCGSDYTYTEAGAR